MSDTLYVIYEGGWYRPPFKKVHYGLDDAIMHYGIEAFYGEGELPNLENAQCVYDIKEAMQAAGFVTVDDLRTALSASVQREQQMTEGIAQAASALLGISHALVEASKGYKEVGADGDAEISMKVAKSVQQVMNHLAALTAQSDQS